jgi:1,4-dihydroxy-2-naphthoate octaprenyltransferase
MGLNVQRNILMGYLQRFTDWLLYASLFAACCATGLCMATERLLIGETPSLLSALHTLVFGSTLLVYNVHFIIKRSTVALSDRYRWTRQFMRWHYIFSALGLVLCTGSIFFLNQNILLSCILLAVLSFAYSLPLLPFPGKKRLKDFGILKIIVLTGVWTIVTSVLPMFYWEKSLGDYPFEILLRFLFMFTLCIAFDIRDMQTDLDAGIYTLPNQIGLRNSYRLMDLMLLLFALLSVVQYLRYPSLQRLGGELVTTLCTRLVIDYARRQPSDKIYLGGIDGMMMLYAIFLLVPGT